MTTTPSECAGTRPLDADLALSAALISADWAQVWRHAKGKDVAKAASVVKRTVAALERTVQEHTRYWSAGEVASFSAAAAALGKLARACGQIPRCHVRWINPEKARYYHAHLDNDLLGGWTLVLTWGGLRNGRGNTLTNSQVNPVPSYPDVLQRLQSIDKRRRHRDYCAAGELSFPLTA